jgi:hypothetical protein
VTERLGLEPSLNPRGRPRTVKEKWNVPSYKYELAAVSAEREHLPLIRLFSQIFDPFGPFHTL